MRVKQAVMGASALAVASLLLWPNALFSAECRWVETDGSATAENITAEEAKQFALNRARMQAVEQVSSVRISGSALVKDFSLISEYIQSISHGYVLEEKVEQWDAVAHQDKKDRAPVAEYTVRLKSCVAPGREGDPYFRVKAEMDRPVYLKGEEARIRATCAKDCYLSIVNLRADGKVKVLLPNDFAQSGMIKAGVEYIFPPPGLALEMHTIEGQKRNTEAMVVIATKERFEMLKHIRKGGDITPKEFYNAVLSLPADTKVEEILLYEVRDKD